MLVLGTVFHSFSRFPGIAKTRDYSQAHRMFAQSMRYARVHYMLGLREDADFAIPKSHFTVNRHRNINLFTCSSKSIYD